MNMKNVLSPELFKDTHPKLTAGAQPNFKKGDEVTFWDDEELCIGIVDGCMIRQEVFRYQLSGARVAFPDHWHREADLESLNKIY